MTDTSALGSGHFLLNAGSGAPGLLVVLPLSYVVLEAVA